MPSSPLLVGVEETPKKSFAAVLDWPGWCRAGRDPDAAIRALHDYAERYAPVAALAGLALPATLALREQQRLPGGSTTAFGAPEVTFDADRVAVSAREAARLTALLNAVWQYFDKVVAESPQELRKGPRGGGRDRDKMIDHVLGAENAYARKIGFRQKAPTFDDLDGVAAQRAGIAAALDRAGDGQPLTPTGWTARYAARRIAWHVLDHAWEMEDRRE